MVRREIIEEVNNLQGGEGTLIKHSIITKDEFMGHGRVYCRFIMPPGASIGWHVHKGETEPYYILKGEGVFVDSDGSEHKVVPGDCCIIEPEHGHALRNESEADLEFMALIYNA